MGSHSESRFAKTRNGGRKDGRNKQPIRSSGCAVFLIVGFGIAAAASVYVGSFL